MTAEHVQAGVQPGEILAGKYRVERILGVGGMGVVVAAHHVQLDEKVALKFLLPEALSNPAALVRFEREARAAVKIKSEHVARVADVGRLDNGAPYMVMEYLEGCDLAAWLTERGPLGVEQAVDFVLQACEAIAEAHVLGIVHRDLKPANLFCIRRADGQLSIKVLDFGISKVTVAGPSNHDMTRTSALVGSPLYMSPEQMQSSKNVDARTDVWSLAVIFYELVAGRVPFQGDSVTELAVKVVTEPAPQLRAFRSDIPYQLEHVISRCLEKERDKRYQTVGDFVVALKDFASVRGRASVERVLGTLQQASVPREHVTKPAPALPVTIGPMTDPSWGHTTGGVKPGSKMRPVAATMVGLTLLTGVAIVVLRARSPIVTPMTPAAIAAPTGAPTTAVPPAPPTEAVSAVTVSLPPLAPAVLTPAVPAAPARPGVPLPIKPPPTVPSAAQSVAPPPAPPAPKPNCDPPYYFDATGTRLFKKECL